jgi:predicted RNA binding protein YcfA (HicA-like mRNA interferase family)
MPPRLPAEIATERAHHALLRLGFVVIREGGRHTIYAHPDRPGVRFALPRHSTVFRILLVGFLRRAGFAEKDFLDVY